MRTLSLFLAAGLVFLSAASAGAQPAAAPAGQPLGGTPLPGVCLLSQSAVVGNAKVGVAAMTRLKQLSDQAQAEVNADRVPIEADAKALEAQRASLKPAEFQQRQQALAGRAQALQQTAGQRSREIEATRDKALARISGEAQPVIAAVYKAHACSMLFDRNAVLGGNMTGDLTADVVHGLDAKITTISFDRETLPAAAQPNGGAGAGR